MKQWLFVLLCCLTTPFGAMAVEEPSYRVLLIEAPFEHRQYKGFVVAETDIVGDFDSASRTGFRRIADYIFGNNVTPEGGNQKIAMTAPVTIEAKSDGWRLHFVMPSGESLNSLPRPNRHDVALRQVSEHEVAAIRFSGWVTESAIEEQTNKLRAWMQTKGLKEGGAPQVARYNDPFTLPWRRRNEILIVVQK